MSASVRKYKLSFTFTELLYGVLIGAALQNVRALTATAPNVMLLLAVLLVADDYFMYNQDIRTRMLPRDKTRGEELKLFFYDILVLASWYSLALASQSASGAVVIPLLDARFEGSPSSLFMVWLVIYYFAVSLWDRKYPTERKSNLCVYPRLPPEWCWVFDNHVLVAVAAAVCAAGSFIYKDAPALCWPLAFFLAFAVWRGVTYADFLRRELPPEPEPECRFTPGLTAQEASPPRA